MKMKNIAALALGVCMAVILCGCDSSEMDRYSDTEKDLMAEYAAGKIIKYRNGGVGTTQDFSEDDPVWQQAITEETVDDVADEDEQDIPMAEVTGVEDVSGLSPVETTPVLEDIAKTIGVDDFDVSYAGYEVADIYPEESGDVLSFSMQAAEGKKLMVLHYNITNNTGADALCDVLDCNVKFRLLINDTKRINQQMTILLNELKSYYDNIAAGDTVDAVLVFEVDADMVEQINTMSVIVVKSDGSEASYPL